MKLNLLNDCKMEDMISQLNNFVLNINCNETVGSLIRKRAEDQLSTGSLVKDYYNLTDLCDSAQIYCFRMNAEIKKTVELQKKLDFGTQLHKFAGVWFKLLPDFTIGEGVLDGAAVGINRVRGRIDFMVGDAIIEFKTKDKLPNNSEEILLLYPQDLEQLAFYSVLHPSFPKTNYLVFMTNSSPFELKAFKITIKDLGKIKSLLIFRRNALDKAFKEKNPSFLGQCRYYKKNCKFDNSKFCFCKDLKPISNEAIKDAVEVKFDKEFTEKLETARKNSETINIIISTKDILAPRKYYVEKILKIKSPWVQDKIKDEYKAYLSSLVKQTSCDISHSERKALFNLPKESRLSIAYRWIKIKSSADPSGYEILPYIVKANMSVKKEYIEHAHPYNLAELGIISAVYGKTKGLIFVVYPRLNNFIQVFEVNYKKYEQLLKMIRESIDNLEKLKENKNFLSLPKCLEFMNDNKTCPLIKECHAEKGNGCIADYVAGSAASSVSSSKD